jgi:hypothetical protein
MTMLKRLMLVLGLRRKNYAECQEEWRKEQPLTVCGCGRIVPRTAVEHCPEGHMECGASDCCCPCPVVVPSEKWAAFLREDGPDANIIVDPTWGSGEAASEKRPRLPFESRTPVATR